MGRNYLAHATGDAINAVLAAAGYTSGASSHGWAFLSSMLALALAAQNRFQFRPIAA